MFFLYMTTKTNNFQASQTLVVNGKKKIVCQISRHEACHTISIVYLGRERAIIIK